MLEKKPVGLEIKPSMQWLALLICVHALAVYALLLMHITAPLGLFLIIFVVYSLYRLIDDARAIPQIFSIQDNEWMLRSRNGDLTKYTLSDKTYLSDWLSLLVFRSNDNKNLKAVVLMRDSVSAEQLSYLKLKLRINNEKPE